MTFIQSILIVIVLVLLMKIALGWEREKTDEEIKDDWRHRWFLKGKMMKNEFKKYSDSTLKKLSKDELIEYIRLLQENLQTLDIQYKRAVEANRKMSECITEENMKEIQNELFKKWEEEENDKHSEI